MHAVQEIRDGFAIPPFDRGAALRAPSRAAKRARLRQYRLDKVEPRIFAATEEEIANEHQEPQSSLYIRLHLRRGPVAAVLKNHESGAETSVDYRRWVRLRVLLRFPAGCRPCPSVDGTAEQILSAQAAPRLWSGGELRAVDLFRLLRTALPAEELRRDIRVVGQTFRGNHDWRWLRKRATGVLEDGVN